MTSPGSRRASAIAILLLAATSLHAAQPTAASVLDARVELLAKELSLDDRQRAEVRTILLQQRADVAQVWRNEAMAAQARVAATRVIGDRTAERIRSLLTDSQREKYFKRRPADPDQETSGAPLDQLMGAVGNK